MIKVGFHIDNSRIADVDCREIAGGNPGIGGTEYLFYLTTLQLQRQASEDIIITLFTAKPALLPDMDSIAVGTKREAIKYCQENRYDILVVKYETKDFDNSSQLLSKENVEGLKVVVWAHNVIPNHILTRMRRLGGVSAIVNVGREQLDLYRDHQMFYRSTYIYNGIPLKPYEYYQTNSMPVSERKHEVTYLGSLIRAKGFHVLASVWKDIVKEIPDAHLNVIGSGKVYNPNQKLGKYGIAEESYENEFMPFLTNEEGDVLDSVTFWGKLGSEKDKILAKTKVGVPNPAGTTETFCLSAVEMAVWGARIVSKKYVGLIDTVPEYVGVLTNTHEQLKNAIISELQRSTLYSYESYEYIDKSFAIKTIANQWIELFKNIIANAKIYNQSNIVNKDYNLKYIREFNRKLKQFLPFGKYMPTVDFYISIIQKLIPEIAPEMKY